MLQSQLDDLQVADEDERHECRLVVAQLIGDAAVGGGRANLDGAELRVGSVRGASCCRCEEVVEREGEEGGPQTAESTSDRWPR